VIAPADMCRTQSLMGNRFRDARRFLFPVVAIAMLCACSTSPQGRQQITTPAAVSGVYSDVDMRIRLATAPSISSPCGGAECTLNQDFDRRVQQLGSRLAKSAFDFYPELGQRVSRFEFVVAEKEELGSASNASGKIVIYRGIQKLNLDEMALAFLIGREMGHVIGRHHDENSATRIIFSVLVGVLFPAVNLFNGGSAAAAGATSATSTSLVASTAASTATSYVGSQVVLASVKPNQLSEADSIALGLLVKLGWSRQKVTSAIEAGMQTAGNNDWAKDFRMSVGHVKALAAEGGATEANLMAAATSPEATQDATQEHLAQEQAGIEAKAAGEENIPNIESGQNPGEPIMLAEMSDGLVADAGKITDDAPSNDTDKASGIEASVLPDSSSTASDAAHTSAIEASQALSTVPLAGRDEGVKGKPESRNAATNTSGTGAGKVAAAESGKPVGARNASVFAAKPDIKMLLAVNLKIESRDGVNAQPGLPIKAQPHGKVGGKTAKKKLPAGALAKATPGNRYKHNGGKVKSPGTRIRLAAGSVNAGQKSVKISRAGKMAKAKSGTSLALKTKAKSKQASAIPVNSKHNITVKKQQRHRTVAESGNKA